MLFLSLFDQAEKQLKKEILVAENIPVIRKDKTVFLADISSSPLTLGGNEYLLGMFRDITERKQAENNLKQNEEKYQALVDNTNDGVYILNTEGRFTFVNHIIEKRSGMSIEQFEKLRFSDILTAEYVAIANENFEKIMRGETVAPYEVQYCTDDKRTLTVEINTLPLHKDGEIVGLQGISRDITERKKAYDALRESESRFRAQYNGNPIPTLTWQKQGDDFILTDFNDSAKTIIGSQGKSFLGIQASELYKSRQDIFRTLQTCFDEKRIIRIESRSEHFMPGKFIVITFVFVPYDLVMVHMEDITERKQAEESLKETELKFRTIFDFASDGILLAQSDSGKFFSANKKICAMLGYNEEELLKLGVSDIHPEESLPYVIEQFEKVWKKEILFASNIPLLKKDKTVSFVDISGSLITLEKKRLSRWYIQRHKRAQEGGRCTAGERK